jgi:DNA-binding NarL/FixJ family response regulator
LPEPFSLRRLTEQRFCATTRIVRMVVCHQGRVRDGKAYPLCRRRRRLQEGLHPRDQGGAALIDVTMPDGNGLGLVGEIHDGGVGRPISTLVLTASLDASVAVEAMDAGARGALSKLAPMREAIDAIRRLTDAGRSEV